MAAGLIQFGNYKKMLKSDKDFTKVGSVFLNENEILSVVYVTTIGENSYWQIKMGNNESFLIDNNDLENNIGMENFPTYYLANRSSKTFSQYKANTFISLSKSLSITFNRTIINGDGKKINYWNLNLINGDSFIVDEDAMRKITGGGVKEV